MKSNILKIAFTAVITAFSFTTNASHLLGGEITWKCQTNNTYIFTLTLYRDCNGTTIATFPQTITNPAGNNITCNFQSITDVTPTCWNQTDPNYPTQYDCNTANDGDPNTYFAGAVQRYIFESGPITLNGTPPANGWEFSWSSCCRPDGNKNTNSAWYYLRSKMYPYIPPGSSAAANVNTCYDNSPVFAENGSPVICLGTKFVYNHLATDRDVDSVAYSFSDPQTAAGVSVAWEPGYSSLLPFPDASEDASNGPVVLDPVSGEMSMEINSFGANANDGSFASCIKVETWRNCQLIAEVYRDVAISVTSGCQVNSAPVTEIDTAIYKKVKKLSDNVYRASLYARDTLQFQILAQDFFDVLPNGVPQTIHFTAGGLQVSNPMNSGTGCLGNVPCAKFTPVAPQTSFSKAQQNRIEFFWSPQCVHLANVSNGCGGVSSTYYFTLKMTDNSCPAPEFLSPL